MASLFLPPPSSHTLSETLLGISHRALPDREMISEPEGFVLWTPRLFLPSSSYSVKAGRRCPLLRFVYRGQLSPSSLKRLPFFYNFPVMSGPVGKWGPKTSGDFFFLPTSLWPRLAFPFHFRISGSASSPCRSPFILLWSAHISKAGCPCHQRNSPHLENFPVDDFWYLVLISSCCVRLFRARQWDQFLHLSVVTDLGFRLLGSSPNGCELRDLILPSTVTEFFGVSVLRSSTP